MGVGGLLSSPALSDVSDFGDCKFRVLFSDPAALKLTNLNGFVLMNAAPKADLVSFWSTECFALSDLQGEMLLLSLVFPFGSSDNCFLQFLSDEPFSKDPEFCLAIHDNAFDFFSTFKALFSIFL